MKSNLVCTACNKNQKNFEVYWWLGYGYICQSCIDNTQNEMSITKNELPDEIIETIKYRAEFGRGTWFTHSNSEIESLREKAIIAIREYKKAKSNNMQEDSFKATYTDLAKKLGIELEK